MNAPFHHGVSPELIRLTVDDFVLLKQFGAFNRFSKSELLEGELWGVPKQSDDEPECDSAYPIKLRVEDYEQLDRAGAFAAAEKTELVDGFVYRMSPQYRQHGFAKDELAYRLRRALEQLDLKLHVATEQSVVLGPHSEPQPDIVLTSEPKGEGAIPGKSVALVVEVSVETLAFDLDDKALIYAEAGIPEYWVVDLKAKVFHLHSRPTNGRYPKPKLVLFDQAVASAMISRLSVDTSGLV